jgi:predicted dehydrogenase
MSGRVARIAVSGAGWWGQGWHLPHLHRHPDAAVAAIVERQAWPRSSNAAQTLETTEALSERYDAPVYPSVEALLASTTEVDGLLVGVSHAAHYEQSMLALDAGLHVLCEKPMTTDVTQARALAAAVAGSAESGRFFAINNTSNWRQGCRSAAVAVATGRIGRVEHVSAQMHSPLLWLFDDEANVGWTRPEAGMAGNGFAWGQLSHLLAWIFHVAPELSPVTAFASMGRSERSGADLHDAAVVVCEGGATISISGSASVPGDAHGDAPVGKRIQARPPTERFDFARCARSDGVSRSMRGRAALALWLRGLDELRRRRPSALLRRARAAAARRRALARRAAPRVPI